MGRHPRRYREEGGMSTDRREMLDIVCRTAVLAGDTDRVEHLLANGYGDKCWTSDPAWRAQLAAHRDWGILSRAELAQKYEQFLTSRRP